MFGDASLTNWTGNQDRKRGLRPRPGWRDSGVTASRHDNQYNTARVIKFMKDGKCAINDTAKRGGE